MPSLPPICIIQSKRAFSRGFQIDVGDRNLTNTFQFLFWVGVAQGVFQSFHMVLLITNFHMDLSEALIKQVYASGL